MRINVCDRHLMFGEALSSLLARRGHLVLARVSSPDGALDVPGAEHADAWLTELDFPGYEGADAVRRLRESTPGIPIVVLTARSDRRILGEALEAGAGAIALKSEGVDEVERALLRACSSAAGSLGARAASRPPSPRARSPRGWEERRTGAPALTRKEGEVISCLARGRSTAAVAVELGMAVSTVRTHLQHLYVKLDVHSRLELVAFAVRHGVVRVEGASEVVSA